MIDPEQIERLFQENQKFIRDLARAVTRNKADADDVVQTIFIRLLRRDSLEKVEENPRGYFHRAALYESFHVVKRRQYQLGPDPKHVGPGPETINPSTEWNVIEVNERLRHAMDQLKPEVRQLVELAYWDGHNDVEIAEMTGKSRSAVSVALTRAREALRKIMCGPEHEPKEVQVHAAKAS